jgi:D-alanyl-lipoteichoic acid acyltransferase DltB (MBOAT superfamily)
MLFNSIEFAIFLPIVFVLYWFVFKKNLKAQNFFLLIVSYIFYGWWDWRFLSLILFSSFVDFTVGIQLGKRDKPLHRKLLLLASIFVNLGFLGFFKYYNFFVENFIEAFRFFGREFSSSSLNIILPVGISFYTFQTLSYSIDVYKRKLEPTKDVVAFFAFVSFFPQLVAGPIERATNLLPQFYKKRQFDYAQATDGLRQILWGLFKKMVIADNAATLVGDIFNNYSQYSGLTLFMGGVFFAFQIYGDFSGYSDIAIGTSRLFGFSLMQNFAFPYFSRDIAEFWRRWHISLSTWFRDYVYIPLGGSRGGRGLIIRNTFIIFVVSGFWHGANWTFIAWGFLNAVYFLPLMLLKKNRKNLDVAAQGEIFPNVREVFQISITFILTVVAWIFFRAENIAHALLFIEHMTLGLFDNPAYLQSFDVVRVFLWILLLVAVEWLQREKQHALEIGYLKIPRIYKWAIYYLLIVFILFFGGHQQEFIYFQF